MWMWPSWIPALCHLTLKSLLLQSHAAKSEMQQVPWSLAGKLALLGSLTEAWLSSHHHGSWHHEEEGRSPQLLPPWVLVQHRAAPKAWPVAPPRSLTCT